MYYVFILLSLSLSLLAHKVSELDKQKQEEQKILHNIQETRGSSFYLLLIYSLFIYQALMSVGELAKGVVYKNSIVTG